MSSSASLDNLNRTSFPSNLPTAAPSPIAEMADPLPSDSPERPHALALAAAQTDLLLTHLLKVFAAPGGTDRVLATSTYTLQLLSALINRRLDSATERLAAEFAEKAGAVLLPGETVVASFQAPPVAAVLATLSVRSRKLASIISEYRVFVRLWGMLGMYGWAKSVYISPPADVVLRWIAYSQVAVNTCFQFLENRAFLAGKGILLRDGRQILDDWCWSSRFWCAHTTLEFVRLYRLRRIWAAERAAETGADKNSGTASPAQNKPAEAWWKDDAAEAKAKRAEEERLWWKDLVVNSAYYPMTNHWSLQDGILSELQIGILGVIACGTGLRDIWKKTAVT